MSVAIDLFGAVYTTSGGTRYHADRACYALANGRAYHDWRAGRTDTVARGTGLYDLERRSVISAVRYAYTACLVCVPAANALPFPIGETYGHEPVQMMRDGWGYAPPICVRCNHRVIRSAWDASGRRVRRWIEWRPVPWPCTSAVVLGLVPRCPDCGNGIDVPGGRKCASCEHSDQLDALGTAL
jgi:hypothetical protein